VNKIYNKTKYRTNYYADNDRIVNGGVSRRFIEGKTGRKLTTKRIDRTDNFSNYKKRDLRESKGIVEYRPSEVTVRGTTINKKNVTKGKELSSLKRDKVVINNKNIIERESGTDLGKNEGSRKIDKKIFEKKSEKRNYNTSKNKNEALEKKENSNSKIIKKNEHKNNSKKSQNLNKYKEVTNRSYRENSNVRLDDKSKLTKIIKKNESTKSNQKEISKRESNNFTRNNSSSTKSYTSNIDKKNTVNDDKSKKQRRR
jgi:hypothetical protein